MKIKHVFVLFTFLAISIFLAESCKSDEQSHQTTNEAINEEANSIEDNCSPNDTTIKPTYVLQYVGKSSKTRRVSRYDLKVPKEFSICNRW